MLTSTVGTLVVLGILGAVGYLRAKSVRAERPVRAPTEDALEVTGGSTTVHL